MVNYYRFEAELYCDGEFVESVRYKALSEEERTDFSEEITWDNLDEVQNKYGIFFPIGTVYQTRKGRKLFICSKDFEKVIREWKKPLNLTIKTTVTTNFYYSIKDILECGNADLAIKYFLERGISVIKESL